jgi:hypothetical protein
MTVTCPRGHESATSDYCDACGARIEGDLGTSTVDDDAVGTDQIVERAAPAEAERCPRCQTPRRADDRFCEVDGYDFVSGATLTVRWEAVVAADREYFDALDAGDVEFPSGYAPRTFALDRDEMLIGRRSASRGIEPEIDLAGNPQDDGISHRHAALVRTADGSYAVVDRGSTNGTSIDGSLTRIPTDTAVAVQHGSRIHVGAWTTITIRAVTDTTP